METMTRGRVYVTIDSNHDPKFISYYDTTNKRFKQIDLDRPHKGVLPHTHHGYEHNENDSTKGYAYLTTEEKKMVEGIKKIWYDWYNKPEYKRSTLAKEVFGANPGACYAVRYRNVSCGIFILERR